MDGALVLIALLLIFFFLFLPIFVFSLNKRVGVLEERVRRAEVELGKQRQLESPEPEPEQRVAEDSAMVRAKKKEHEEAPAPEKPGPIVAPPPLPVGDLEQAGEQEEGAIKEPRELSPERRPAPEPVQAGPNPVMVWLEKVGLKPPHAGEEGANLIAWWSTRAGLALGVIAAVFFGLYVNQNTVPWVRLVELVLLAFGLFGAGWWLERRLASFGRALSAGGLALLYVGAYASYGLPAMKVIDAPLIGAVVQVLAIGLMAGWSLWRNNEGIYGLALALGYVTSWFAYQEGVEPLPLISLLVLAAAGAALFALRGWWSGFWCGLGGSSGGLILLAVVRWASDGGPREVVGLGSACLLTVMMVAALYLRGRKGEPMIKVLLPLVTSVGVLVGLVVTSSLSIEWEWYYATYAVMLLVIGLLWRTADEVGLWEVMWAKASVFIALFLIAKFDGPVRAYGLLAQAGSLAFLARKKGWLVFDVGALLALATGWYYVQAELVGDRVPIWGMPELIVLGFLFGALGLVGFFGQGRRFEHQRERIVAGVVALLALGVCWVAMWRVDHEWALLAGLLAAGVFLVVGRIGKIWNSDLVGVIFLLSGFLMLAARGVSLSNGNLHVSEVAWPLIVWLVAAWSYSGWLGLAGGLPRRIGATLVMGVSIAAAVFAGVEFFDVEWIQIVLLGLGLLWRWGHGRVPIPDLKPLSIVSVALGALVMLSYWWGDLSNGVLWVSVLFGVGYWATGVVLREEESDSVIGIWSDAVRTLILGVAFALAIKLRLEGAMMVLAYGVLSSLLIALWKVFQERFLAWVALVSAALAFLFMIGGPADPGWHQLSVAVLFVLAVANGLVLARSERMGVLSQPKVASVVWGGLALLTVLGGLSMDSVISGSTTAFWAVGAVALLAAGFWGGLRGYRVMGLAGIGCAILRLFAVDLQETFWRIVAFGVTGALLIGIGYVYNRFHQRLAEHDLDWRKADDEAVEASSAVVEGEPSEGS